MRRVLLVALCLPLALSACMPAFLQQTINPTPVPNLEATAAALGATMAVQTLQAMPSPTPLPSSTPVIAAASSNTPIASATPSQTASATPTNVTGTPGTPGTVVTGMTPTGPTGTLHAQFFGTRPPLVPSGRLLLMNRSHAEAYVSFQCINMEGSLTILEYPVTRWMEIKFPSGKCDYVAWVGGREFVGKFALDTGGQRMIIFYLDRIKIK